MKRNPKDSGGISRRQFIDRSCHLGAVSLVAALPGGWLAALAAAATPATSWQIGCYTRPWDQHDYRVAFDAIAEAGYKYVGLMTTKTGLVISAATSNTEAARIGDEIKQRRLTVLSIYGGDFLAEPALAAGIDGLKRLIDNCAAAGSPNLMLGGTGDDKLVDTYYRVVAECCEYAAQKGVALSIKPHGGSNATGVECRKLIARVGHKNFGLWYDPGNISYYSDGKLDPVNDAATVDGLVMGMSVKDFKPPKEVLVTPGTGRVDFPAVFARLKQGGFTKGPLLVECLERGDLDKLLAEAKKARQFLENLTK